ncbi:MAG: guanylate kinase [Thiotrichaceae bacterium]
MCVSISHTTRPRRTGEIEGVNYHFIAQDDFLQKVAHNQFLEHAQVFDHYYGTSQPWVVQQLKKGIDVVLEIDWQGALQVRKLKPDCISIFVLPPSRAALEQRLQQRGQDSDAVIARRMDQAIDELTHYIEFDYLIVNDQFDVALRDLQSIVHSQRLTHRIQAQKQENLLKSLLA